MVSDACRPRAPRAGKPDKVRPRADTQLRVLLVLGLRRRLTRLKPVVVPDVAVPKAGGRQVSKGAGLISASRFCAALPCSPAAVRALHAAVVGSDASVPRKRQKRAALTLLVAVAGQRGLQTAARRLPAYAVLAGAGLLSAQLDADGRALEARASGLLVAVSVVPFSGVGGRKAASVSAGTARRTFALPKHGVGAVDVQNAVPVKVSLLLPLLPACGRAAAEKVGRVRLRASGLGAAAAGGKSAVVFGVVIRVSALRQTF